MTRAIIKCVFDSIYQEPGYGQRLRCKLKENHPDTVTAKSTEFIITSQLKSIDFENRIAVTQNNIYVW